MAHTLKILHDLINMLADFVKRPQSYSSFEFSLDKKFHVGYKGGRKSEQACNKKRGQRRDRGKNDFYMNTVFFVESQLVRLSKKVYCLKS